MNFKAYGTEMLEKQLKYAKKKGNDDYASELETELKKREAAKKPVKKSKRVNDSAAGATLASTDVQPEEPKETVEPTAPLNSDGSEADLSDDKTETGTEEAPSE